MTLLEQATQNLYAALETLRQQFPTLQIDYGIEYRVDEGEESEQFFIVIQERKETA